MLISTAFRKYLRFVWDNKVFQFRALPFGLAIAPLVFTKIFQVVSAHLHTLSIQIHSYLDDSLVKELNPDILLSHTQTVIDLLLELGFLISWKKSEVIPSQDFVFLGEHFRTDLGLVFPPEKKFLALRQFILTFLAKTSVTARQFSQLLGLLNSLADVVQLGRLPFVLYSFIFSSIGPRLLRIGKPLFLSLKLSLLICLGGCRGKLS